MMPGRLYEAMNCHHWAHEGICMSYMSFAHESGHSLGKGMILADGLKPSKAYKAYMGRWPGADYYDVDEAALLAGLAATHAHRRTGAGLVSTCRTCVDLVSLLHMRSQEIQRKKIQP